MRSSAALELRPGGWRFNYGKDGVKRGIWKLPPERLINSGRLRIRAVHIEDIDLRRDPAFDLSIGNQKHLVLEICRLQHRRNEKFAPLLVAKAFQHVPRNRQI